ncbi:MAG: UbiX family flavin prenyltransferase [Acidimicrobiales bacterium]|nr:MAG: 3-octaprenyl-4-hydroxybenzoate carboxy-lyase [marine actinobacterium MedAcidi-G1]MDC0234049.1 UbiX family flavin prenyltransferase [Acidimicrobiia bacterium]HAQ05095.1 UbiX family flavin prenyltransferase [Acidimicrobiaceae bacterium]
MHRLVVGISGASGVIYGIRILEILRDIEEVETHLILTNAAKQTIGMETDFSSGEIEKLADCSYPIKDISAGPASGTFPCDGMIVAPCSIRTLSAVANSHSSDLLTRTADVTLKEKRPLILMVRETPFHLGHLRLMQQVAEIGGVIFPPVPAFYNKHRDLDEVISHTAKRAIEQAGIEIKDMDRWTGPLD